MTVVAVAWVGVGSSGEDIGRGVLALFPFGLWRTVELALFRCFVGVVSTVVEVVVADKNKRQQAVDIMSARIDDTPPHSPFSYLLAYSVHKQP